MPQEYLTVINKKYRVIKDTPVTYIAQSGQLSGEATITFKVGQNILGVEYVQGLVSTTPEGTAVDPNEVGQTLVQLPKENLEEVKSILAPENVKKYALLWAMAATGLVFGVYYLVKVKKVFKKA